MRKLLPGEGRYFQLLSIYGLSFCFIHSQPNVVLGHSPGIEDLQFIFTSPTFVAEKTEKSKREFFIPRMTREQNLYGTEFEVRLRNELTQRTIAKECAAWIKQKATFKSNTPSKATPAIAVVKTVTRLVTMKSMGMEPQLIN